MLAALISTATVPALGQLQIIRQGDESTGTRQNGDRFGDAVALGDFNGDGFGDLATGVPREKGTNPLVSVGAVTVSRGNKWGIGWSGAVALGPFDGGHLSDSSLNYRFGEALATGDFDNDGFDDLVVGASNSSSQRVFIYRGSAAGLVTPPTAWKVTDFGVSGSATGGFGRTFAVGKFNSDAFDDLVIGSPGHNGSGALFVLRGSAAGLVFNAAGAVIGVGDLPSSLSAGCGFGSSLAVGNVAGFDRPDLIVGAPLHDEPGKANVGAVVLIPGTDAGSGLIPAASLRYLTSDIGLQLRAGSRLGQAVTTGEFRGDGGHMDFAASMMFGQVGETDSAIVWRGGLFSPVFERVIDNPLGSATVSNFGASLAAGDLDGDGKDELAVGAPLAAGTNGGATLPASGVVYFFNGGPSGPFPTPGTTLRASDFEDLPEASLEFGAVMTAGRTTSEFRDSFIIGSPGKDLASGEAVDYSPWRQPLTPRCASAIAVNCDGDITYALRIWDRRFIASTTKIMTVLLACEATQRPQGDPLRRTLNREYTIEPWTLVGFPNVPGGCSRYNFVQGDVVTFEDLIHATIMPSGNDAAMCIADVFFNELSSNVWPGLTGVPVFVSQMNNRADLIGMDDTVFTNPAGVDAGTPLSTAWDMYLLAKEAMANPLFAQKIGTTTYQTAATTGDGNLNRRTINYGWLNNRKGVNGSVIGLKPGVTPGAGTTAVLAAPSGTPGALAYAAGFGWQIPGSATAQDRLIRFAQDSCPKPPIPVAGNLTQKLNPTHVGPDPVLLSGAVHDLRTDAAAGGLTFDLDFQAASSQAAENLTATMNYRVGVLVEPDETFSVSIGGVYSSGEIGIGGVEGQPASPVDYSVTRPDRPLVVTGATVPVMSDYIPIAGGTQDPNSPLVLTVKNAGTERIFLALNFDSLEFRPRFGARPPFRQSDRFSLSKEPVRQNFDMALAKSAGGEADLFFAIQSGEGDAIFFPEVRTTAIALEPGATSGDQVRLDWTAPAEYYTGFRILYSPDLDAWEPLDTVPPAGTGEARQWQGPVPVPNEGRGFFRVEGLLEN